LVKAERCPAARPPNQGVAAVRRVLRDGNRNVASEWARLTADTYGRARPKKARHWPHEKRERPPGRPKARNATDAELSLAQELGALEAAA
jgi:hypothetical protein